MAQGTAKRRAGTTNRESAFRPRDVISYADDTYEVTVNWGDSGQVTYYPPAQDDGDPDVFTFRWHFDGEDCVLVTPAEDRTDL